VKVVLFYFNSVQCLDGHISTYFNKNTCDLCCVKCSYASYIMQNFIIVVKLLFILFDFCFHPILLCFLFIVPEEIFSSNPGLYSRHHDPIIQEP
jgi:hypothetical protein